jgi:hypothetical protein
MQHAPFAILSGGTYETVVNEFLLKNRILGSENDRIVPHIPAAKNISALTRTGMEQLAWNPEKQNFTLLSCERGLTEEEKRIVIHYLFEAIEHFKLKEKFHAASGYTCIEGLMAGAIRADSIHDQDTFVFLPAGRLNKESRARFLSEAENHILIRSICQWLNERFKSQGLSGINAARGGDTTIDILTTSKQQGVRLFKSQLPSGIRILYLGDKFLDRLPGGSLLIGNDYPVISEVDTILCVGRTEVPPDLHSRFFSLSGEHRFSSVAKCISAQSEANMLALFLNKALVTV